MQVVRDIFGQAQCALGREEEIHLRGRLGARSQLEHDPDAVQGLFLPGRVMSRVGAISPTVPVDVARAKTRSPGPPRRSRDSAIAAVVHAAAQHRAPGVHVLRNGVLHEVLRRHDRHVGVRVHNAEHTAEMVEVGVGVDDCGDRLLPAVRPVQGRCRRGTFLRDQRIDDDHAGVGLDQRHVRQIRPANLIDARGDLEEPLYGGELALPPETRVYRVRAIALHRSGVGVDVEHHPAIGILDHAGLQPGDQPPFGVLEIGAISEIGRHLGPPVLGPAPPT